MKTVFPPAIFKIHANKSMQGNFFKAVAASLLPALIISAVAIVLVLIPPVSSAINLYSQGMFNNSAEQMQYLNDIMSKLLYGINLITVLFYFLIIGGEKVCLDIVRGRKTKIRNIFSFYDKWYVALIWPAISLALSFGFDFALACLENMGVNSAVVSVMASVCQVVVLVLSIKTLFLPYTLADTSCNFKKAFSRSWKLINFKTAVNIFLLYISFIGWFLLVALTGFAFVYVYPYFKLSVASLYIAAVNTQKESTYAG